MRKPPRGGGSPAPATACCSKVGIKRGPWTAEEDEVLAGFVRREGEGRWRTLPKRAGLLRCGKSCRLRWMNYLRPSVKRGHIAADEEDLILRLHRLLGNRWSLIAGRIPGRTDNEIKNYWNTHLSKKLISQGIDPRTHKPFKPNDHPLHDNTNARASSSSCKTGEDRRRRMSHSDRTNPKINVKQNTQEPHQDQALTNAMQVQNDIFFELEVSDKNNSSNNNDTIVGFGSVGILGDDYTNLPDEDYRYDDHRNYCSDDMFSSFINSLINEDVDQPFLSPNLDASHGWETSILSSSFDQIGESQRIDDLPME